MSKIMTYIICIVCFCQPSVDNEPYMILSVPQHETSSSAGRQCQCIKRPTANRLWQCIVCVRRRIDSTRGLNQDMKIYEWFIIRALRARACVRTDESPNGAWPVWIVMTKSAVCIRRRAKRCRISVLCDAHRPVDTGRNGARSWGLLLCVVI